MSDNTPKTTTIEQDIYTCLAEALKNEGLNSEVADTLALDKNFHEMVKKYIEVYLLEGEEAAQNCIDKYFHDETFAKNFDEFLKTEENDGKEGKNSK